MNAEKKLSLVVPVYNEAEIIAETVEIFLKDLADLFAEFELIVVDDASTDETGAILKHLQTSCPGRLKIITNRKNRGGGSSLLAGFTAARYPFIATNFADRPFDLKELKNIMPLFDKGADFVVVCRRDRSANSFYRKITSLVNYYLIRSMFRVRVGDFQFVQVYRKEDIRGLNIRSRRTFVPAEIIIKLLRRGRTMAEYKADFYARVKGRAKCGHPRIILRALFDMLRFRFQPKKEIIKGK